MIEAIIGIAITTLMLYGLRSKAREPTPRQSRVNRVMQSNLHHLNELNNELDEVREMKLSLEVMREKGGKLRIQRLDDYPAGESAEMETLEIDCTQATYERLMLICNEKERRLTDEMCVLLEAIQNAQQNV